MTATASAELMAELDDVINDRSPARRVEILRQVASLFLSNVDHLTQPRSTCSMACSFG